MDSRGPSFLDLGRLEADPTPDQGTERAALDALRRWRTASISQPLLSVCDKTVPAPGGERADFFSIPTYLWPDPDAPDGRGWVFRDCVRNPTVESMDVGRFFKLVDTVEILTLLTWYDADDEAGDRAIALVRAWFLTPATRMNPNLEFAQWSPDGIDGPVSGIIDFQRAYLLLDLLELLRQRGHGLAPSERAELRRWFARLLDWLLTSDAGADESGTVGNHATWFDVQVVAYALFVGDTDQAHDWLVHRTMPRLAQHLARDGSQPLELARPAGIEYSTFNLFGICVLAELGRDAGVDLWGTASFRESFARATDWLVPYWTGRQPVGATTKHHGTFTMFAEAAMILTIASGRLERGDYLDALAVATLRPTSRSSLLVRAPPSPTGEVGPVPQSPDDAGAREPRGRRSFRRVRTSDAQPYRTAFIVGCPRSGTVWTRDILECHPLVVSGPESHLLTQLGPAVSRPGSRRQRRERVLARYDACCGERWDVRGPQQWISRDDLEKILRTGLEPGDEALDLVEQVLDGYFAAHGGTDGRVLVEKTPDHVPYAEKLLRRFPGARIVEVLRDGRDVVASLGHVAWAPPDRSAQISKWVRAVESGMYGRARPVAAGRWHVLRFEALKAQPRQEIARLFDFLELPRDDEFVLEVARATDFVAMQRSRNEFRHRRLGAVGTWRNELSPADCALFEELAGATLEAAGYGADGVG